MRELRVQVSLSATSTRVVATEDDETGSTTVLRAALDTRPSHPRALQWLLEAIALWQGSPVRAVLTADSRRSSSATPLWDEWFGDFGGALYTLEVEAHHERRRRRDRVGALRRRPRQLVLFAARRSR
ncbi:MULTISPECIES: hypothetical protein [Sandaracinus]|uniref:hypothetical protein n=1 Tax=Sandaracinus TaxID=1055688 RepID=UPI0019D45471|nr:MULTISPECIES: hypothetical protein [Sandaracinus]UJR87238.1 Hypothetical protein I5071_290 [Sandaracinus amylolyticus]